MPDPKKRYQKPFMRDCGFSSTDFMQVVDLNRLCFLICIRSTTKPVVTKIRRLAEKYHRLEEQRLYKAL